MVRMAVTAQEYADIMNLYSRYNLLSDAGDSAEFGACFTEDGAMLVEGALVRRGREAHTAFKREDQAGRVGKKRRHWNGSILLEKTADGNVRGRCYLRVFDTVSGQAPVLVVSGVYDDLVVKVKGEWKFASRNLSYDYRNL
jgi:hypothetical protein